MGTINSLPIQTTKIDELPIYGVVDLDAKKKDLIEISKNSGDSSSPIYATGGSRKIPIDEFQKLIGQSPRFFEKHDYYELVYSSLIGENSYDGKFMPFEITNDMRGHYLTMELVNSQDGTNNNLIWSNNLAWDFQFVGVFDDGFCIRINSITLGGSKTNVSDKYLTSGKTFDFVYNLDQDVWVIDELQSINNPSISYLPMYNSEPSVGYGYKILLTNSNHTYIFNGNNFSSPGPTSRKYTLPPTNVWKGRYIRILIDSDGYNSKDYGPVFYPTPFAILSGVNNYVGAFNPIIDTYYDRMIVQCKFVNYPTNLVTIDAGAGSRKVYLGNVQAGIGNFDAVQLYQFRYDKTLDSNVGGWAFEKTVLSNDFIEGEGMWKFPYGTSGIKKGSYVVFESDGFGAIKISDMNIII